MNRPDLVLMTVFSMSMAKSYQIITLLTVLLCSVVTWRLLKPIVPVLHTTGRFIT